MIQKLKERQPLSLHEGPRPKWEIWALRIAWAILALLGASGLIIAALMMMGMVDL